MIVNIDELELPAKLGDLKVYKLEAGNPSDEELTWPIIPSESYGPDDFVRSLDPLPIVTESSRKAPISPISESQRKFGMEPSPHKPSTASTKNAPPPIQQS
jgi:hypothetical protein